MTRERNYVLGTHDAEIARLALQHRVWRARALDGWIRAGFAPGQTVVDVGSGPGYATADLAEIVGPAGRVVAVDRSTRFLETLLAGRAAAGQDNVAVHELDLDEAPLPVSDADGAWCRWVLAFVKRPRDLLSRIRDALRPGGVFVSHEYFDYATWRLAPRLPQLEEFVAATMKSWRDSGGEPDVGLDVPRWLEELEFEVSGLRPFVDIVPPSSFIWHWPASFLGVNLRRMVELGYLSEERAAEILAAFAEAERRPHTRMVTPAVLEVIAVRR